MPLYSLNLRPLKDASQNSQIALSSGYPLRSFGISHLITILHRFRLWLNAPMTQKYRAATWEYRQVI